MNILKKLMLKWLVKADTFVSVDMKSEDILVFILKEPLSEREMVRMSNRLSRLGKVIIADAVSVDKIIHVNNPAVVYETEKKA